LPQIAPSGDISKTVDTVVSVTVIVDTESDVGFITVVVISGVVVVVLTNKAISQQNRIRKLRPFSSDGNNEINALKSPASDNDFRILRVPREPVSN
jgi:hypothetical protein